MVESLVAVEQDAYEDLSDDLEDLQDSVTVLLANADSEPEWVDDIEAIQQRLEEIGWELNLTRERIRQIERKALGRLRGDANVAELRELLS